MKAFAYSVPFLLLLSGFASFLGLSRLKKEPPSSSSSDLAPLVTTSRVEQCNDGFRIRVDGEVIPYREISLAAEVGGRVVSKSPVAHAGSYIREGELLFEIDARDYELEVRRLQELVNQAASAIEESDTEKSNVESLIELADDDLELQHKEFVRYQELIEKNATSVSQLEAIRRRELQAVNALQTLRNQARLIEARRNRLVQEKEGALTALDKATLDLKRTKLTSPLDGVVIEDMVEADDYVLPGTPLVRLEDTSKVEVRFNLRMDQLRWLWDPANGTKSESSPNSLHENYRLPPIGVTIKLELDGHHFAWPARIARYDGAGINPGTRTVPCIAVVEDPSAVRRVATETSALPLPGPPTLLRGMFVAVEIPVGAAVNLVRIPSLALRPGNKVWLDDGGILRVQPVQVAHNDDEFAILLTGPSQVAAGHRIITSPLPMAVDGMEIRSAAEAAPLTALEVRDTDAL